MDAGERDTWQCPGLIIRIIHQQDSSHHTVTTGHTNLSHKPRAPVYLFSPSARSQSARGPWTSQRPLSGSYPIPLPRGMIQCSPSCRCPDGRCLPARTGGCSRAQSPHGCRCRRSRASTPGSHNRKSTALGGRRRPGEAARAARRAARRARGSGLRTPASWCRAQGRARAVSRTALLRRHGGTDGRAHLAWHRFVAPAARPLPGPVLNPPVGRRCPPRPAAVVIGAGQIPFWPITFGFCFPVYRSAP